MFCGPDSVVGIATGYGPNGPGIESRWRRDFPHLSRPALRPTQPPVQWVPGLSRGVKCGRGVTLTPHPLLVPWSRKGRAIPLLPLWAVRPVQSLSACTRVHFTFTLQYSYTSTPPMGRTACTEPQCLYKGALYLSPFFILEMQKWGLTEIIYITSIARTDTVTNYVCPLLSAKLSSNETTKQKCVRSFWGNVCSQQRAWIFHLCYRDI